MTEPDIDRFESRRSTVYAPSGLVATSQPLAASAGAEILRAGGNAFDAAVATAAALNVVEPTSTGLGGDVFMLYRTADGEIGGMQSCGPAPAGTSIGAVRDAVAADTGIDPGAVTMPVRGPHTVTVPGTARGWEETIERFGSRSLGTVLSPAIRLASEGYPVTEVVASQWRHAEDLFTDRYARGTYLLDGHAPGTGDVIRLPDLADSLERIATDGADVLYEGRLADAIVDAVRSHGGFLSREDLASFEPEFVDPVSTTYGGAEVYELPPVNQGLIALEALNIAAEVDAGSYPYGSPDRVHYFAESMKRAFHDGHHYIADPAFEPVPPLESREYAASRARSIGDRAADTVPIGAPGDLAEDADTVLMCVVDDEGNVVSYINSRFMGFGSGLVAEGTGIALQNRGASFSLDSGDPNALSPGKRPFHTLVPGVVGFGSDDWAAFGVMGGYMQPQGHVQVLSNIVDYGMPAQAALDAPRWRYREGGELAVEARFDGDLLTKLARRGHEVVVEPPANFGGAQFARLNGDVRSGATEPRKDGAVVGY